ncbi:MAG: IS630 family transposase [Rickettsiaceae bacterium]|nr:IS630 family transposase [Rickettsiaceae bacterium]
MALVEDARSVAESRSQTLRVMFQDEARFGRITDPSRCWAQKGVRPVVGKQLVREYVYAYGAVSPQDGQSDFLILSRMDQECFGIFLDEISQRHHNDYILMICDGASCHKAKFLDKPDNIKLVALPPYSPQLNPQENIWDDMREKWFKNILDSAKFRYQDIS